MRPQERYILYFMGFAVLFIIAYGLYSNNQLRIRQMDLDETMNKKELQNDSLRLEIARIEAEKQPYIESNKQEQANRNNYEASRKQKQAEILRSTTDRNKLYNDSIIYNYRSKYK